MTYQCISLCCIFLVGCVLKDLNLDDGQLFLDRFKDIEVDGDVHSLADKLLVMRKESAYEADTCRRQWEQYEMIVDEIPSRTLSRLLLYWINITGHSRVYDRLTHFGLLLMILVMLGVMVGANPMNAALTVTLLVLAFFFNVYLHGGVVESFVQYCRSSLND